MPLRVGQEIQALPRPLRLNARPPVRESALASPILVLGAPRSGTTWLAKIIDSHPEVLYRHEPDSVLPPPDGLATDAVPALVATWAAERGAKTVTKQPFFPKAWQPWWARGARTLIAGAVGAAGRLPGPFRALAGARVPDLATRPPLRLLIKSIEWSPGAMMLSRALPDSRTVFVLRHPCGQVASVMRGNRQQRFDLRTAGTDMPFDEIKAIAHAAARGVNEPSFQALPDAAKYAWSWRAFNEPAHAGLASLSNAHIVLYEALCARPETEAKRIMAFAGLDWTDQTARFVARSTSHAGDAGYYAIYRDAVAAADGWRTKMRAADRDAVRAVMAGSPLARLWPDLTAPPGA